jgi:hypothetical protein
VLDHASEAELSEAERTLPAEMRFELAVVRCGQQFGGYIGFHGALTAARDALQDSDPEVAQLFLRQAGAFLEGPAESARERSERLAKLGRRIGPDSRVYSINGPEFA